MSIYSKIQACRASIKASNLKKKGWNDYSKYEYYTPEQVDQLVHQVCIEQKLFHKFSMIRNEFGITGIMTIIDLEGNHGEAVFEMATDIPSIKATNITQQIGGAMTYTNRYMLQNIFDIVDNNLDFDSQDNRPKQKNTPPKANHTVKPEKEVDLLDIDQITEINDLIKESGADVKELFAFLNKKFEVLYVETNDIRKKHYNYVKKILENKRDKRQ